MARRAATKTKGAARPPGFDANIPVRNYLHQEKIHHQQLTFREAIPKIARKMCTEDCKYLKLFIYNRLVPLKTHSNNVRPICIAEVLRRIIGKCLMNLVKEDVQKAVGNLQVCAGQHAGAEAAIHAMRELYDDKECEAVLLVDASNAFNTLNREVMMHNIGILCPTLTIFVQNTYRQPPHT